MSWEGRGGCSVGLLGAGGHHELGRGESAGMDMFQPPISLLGAIGRVGSYINI
jgi:hypothetical protein